MQVYFYSYHDGMMDAEMRKRKFLIKWDDSAEYGFKENRKYIKAMNQVIWCIEDIIIMGFNIIRINFRGRQSFYQRKFNRTATFLEM